MGVTSAGLGHGSTFFFELPLYGSQCVEALAPGNVNDEVGADGWILVENKEGERKEMDLHSSHTNSDTGNTAKHREQQTAFPLTNSEESSIPGTIVNQPCIVHQSGSSSALTRILLVVR